MLSMPSAVMPAKKHHVAIGRLPPHQADNGQNQARQPSDERKEQEKAHRSCRLNHTNNKNSGPNDSTKNNGPPRR